jgi:hypothetical protein
MKAYKLDAATVTTIEDVAAILNGLGLVMRDDAPMFDELSKYFTDEVAPPEAIAEGEGPIAQED